MTSAVKPKPADTFLLPNQAGLTLPGKGQAWLNSLRNTAAENFISKGLPTVRDEEWRYTNIRRLKRQNFTLQFTSPDISEIKASLPDYDVTRIFLINGLFSPAASKDAVPSGISIESLSVKLADDSLKGLLGSTLPVDKHAFVDLNTAHCFDGVVTVSYTHLTLPTTPYV